MSQRISSADQDQSNKIKESSYYKQLQNNLQKQRVENQEKQRVQQETKERLSVQKEQQTRTAKENVQQTNPAIQDLLSIKDEVDLSSFSWDKETPKESQNVKDGVTNLKAKKMETDGLKILRAIGIKIDFYNKLSELKESFVQNTIQARSHNFFLAKYAQFKVGVIGQLLSILGVSQEEIQKMQKKALESSADENMQLMGENLYNLEITELVHGRGKKVRRSLLMFREIEKQLMTQMTLIGKPNYWTKIRLIEERIRQCKKIKEEFNQERSALLYQFELYKQEGLYEQQYER
jgi:hypothetical protein